MRCSMRRPLLLLVGVPVCILLLGVEFASETSVKHLSEWLASPLMPQTPVWLTESGVPSTVRRTLHAWVWVSWHAIRLSSRLVAALVVGILGYSTSLRQRSAEAAPGSAGLHTSDPMVHYASVLTVVTMFVLWAITPLLHMLPCVATMQRIVAARVEAVVQAHNHFLVHLRNSSKMAAAIFPHALFVLTMALFFAFVPETARIVSQSWASVVVTVVFPVAYGGKTAVALLRREDAAAKGAEGGEGNMEAQATQQPKGALVSEVARSWARNAIASSTTLLFAAGGGSGDGSGLLGGPARRVVDSGASSEAEHSRDKSLFIFDKKKEAERDSGTPSKERRRRPSKAERHGAEGGAARLRRAAPGDAVDAGVPHAERDRRARHWLRYFVSSSLLLMAVKLSFVGMGIAYVLQRFLPHSDEVELFLIVWLQLPLTNGAQILLRVATPLINRHVISLSGAPTVGGLVGLNALLRYAAMLGLLSPRKKAVASRVVGDSGVVVFFAAATVLCYFIPLLPRWVSEMGVTLVSTSYPAYAAIIALQGGREHIARGGAEEEAGRRRATDASSSQSVNAAALLEAGSGDANRGVLAAQLAAGARLHWLAYFVVWTPVLALYAWASTAFAWLPGWLLFKLFTSLWLQLRYCRGAERVTRAWAQIFVRGSRLSSSA